VPGSEQTFSRPIAGDAMAALLASGRMPMPFLTADEALARAMVWRRVWTGTQQTDHPL
jgi:hypothetical protein